MENTFVLVYHTLLPNSAGYKALFELLASNYPTKNATDNIIIIISTSTTKEISLQINPLLGNSYYLCINMDSFHGRLPQNVFDWMKEKNPNLSWTKE